MPGRRSTPVRSIILLQRAVYRSELRIELRADALNCGDDRNAMLLAIRQYDRGRAGFIVQQWSSCFDLSAGAFKLG